MRTEAQTFPTLTDLTIAPIKYTSHSAALSELIWGTCNASAQGSTSCGHYGDQSREPQRLLYETFKKGKLLLQRYLYGSRAIEGVELDVLYTRKGGRLKLLQQ